MGRMASIIIVPTSSFVLIFVLIFAIGADSALIAAKISPPFCGGRGGGGGVGSETPVSGILLCLALPGVTSSIIPDTTPASTSVVPPRKLRGANWSG